MKDDLELLQGTWSVAELVVEGQTMPESLLNGARAVVKKNRFVSQGMGADYEGTIELDPSQSPSHLTIRFDAGPEKGNTNLCIYELKGDIWKMCIATRGNVRPEDFVSPPGSGFAVETLHRGVKPAASNRKSAKPTLASSQIQAEPVTEFEGDWQMISGTFDGNTMPQTETKWVRRTTKGNVTIVKAGPQTMLQCEFVLETSQSPKKVRYVLTAGPSKGKTQNGIYTIQDDVLTICMSAPGGKTPAGFESLPGSGNTLTSWKRT